MVYMNFFDHKNLGNHLLQLCPKVVKHPVCGCMYCMLCFILYIMYFCYMYFYCYVYIFLLLCMLRPEYRVIVLFRVLFVYKCVLYYCQPNCS